MNKRPSDSEKARAAHDQMLKADNALQIFQAVATVLDALTEETKQRLREEFATCYASTAGGVKRILLQLLKESHPELKQ